MQSQYDTRLVLSRGATTPGSAGGGLALADLGRDEGEGRPLRERPGKADEGDEDGGASGGRDDEGEGHAGGEEEVGEEPGAAEGEPGDLGGGEEAREAGVSGWAGDGWEEGRHACGHGSCGVRRPGEGAEGVRAGDGGGGGAVGGDDDEGEEGVGQEGGDGEDEQGEGRDAGGAFPGEVDVGGG